MKMRADELETLLAALPPMTSDERIEQGLDFAYGQLAASTRHKPRRLAFEDLAIEKGWDISRFNQWADQRWWW